MWIGCLYTEYVGFEYEKTEQKRICSAFFIVLYWAKNKYIGKKERMEGLL